MTRGRLITGDTHDTASWLFSWDLTQIKVMTPTQINVLIVFAAEHVEVEKHCSYFYAEIILLCLNWPNAQHLYLPLFCLQGTLFRVGQHRTWVLSKVCAEVFEVLISSPLGWVVKLNGGTALLSEGTALPRIPSTTGPGTLSWAVSSQRPPRLRERTVLQT